LIQSSFDRGRGFFYDPRRAAAIGRLFCRPAECQGKELNKMAECPVCGAEVKLAPDAEKGEILSCADCGSDLEVTGEDSVQEAPQEEEDWGE
jgi:alpha-aminoadipate carrier protein LysW